jgi:hypothetical protein
MASISLIVLPGFMPQKVLLGFAILFATLIKRPAAEKNRLEIGI